MALSTSFPNRLIRSLEDFRAEQMCSISDFLPLIGGINEATYRRLLRQPATVRPDIKRRVFTALQKHGFTSPYEIAELLPLPSPIVQAHIQQIIDESDAEGWIAYDPETFAPTNELFAKDGRLC
jgi:hypothetical protein